VLLDHLARDHDREPGDIKRTVMLPVLCWRDSADRLRRLAYLCGAGTPFSGMSIDDLVDTMQTYMAAILGTPEHVVEQMRAYAAAGAEEMMIQWFGMDDIEGLEVLAEHVMPHV